jgi:predicted RNA-binding protein with RPS1 domain
MVHVSDMSESYVKNPNDILAVGQKVEVRVKEIDEMGRLNLSMMLDPGFDARKEERRKEQGGGGGGERRFDRSPRRDDRGGGSRGGPHFPTSRFLRDDRNDKRNSR